MIRKILHSPSLLLAGGYAAGQGSMFLMQLAVKQFGYDETLGMIVILVSVVSFALQFTDIGNSTFMVRAIARGENDTAAEFLKARVVVAFFICSLFSAWIYFEHKEIVGMVTLVTVPIIGAICGGTATAYLEANRRYFLLTIANAMPWLSMSMMCGLSAFYLNANYIFAMVLITVALICMAIAILVATRCTQKLYFSRKLEIRAIQSVWSFFLPQMGGQIWFRVVIFELNNKIGLAALGIFGLFRYVQVATLLVLGFMTRPQLQKYIATCEKNSDYKLIDLLRLYKTAFIFAMFGPIIWVISKLVVVPAGWYEPLQWLVLLVALPLTLVSISVTQLNQLTRPFQYVVFVEALCLGLNVVTFYHILSVSASVAIVAGEAIAALANVFLFFLMRPRILA